MTGANKGIGREITWRLAAKGGSRLVWRVAIGAELGRVAEAWNTSSIESPRWAAQTGQQRRPDGSAAFSGARPLQPVPTPFVVCQLGER